VSFFRVDGQLANFVLKNITTIERGTSEEAHFSHRQVAHYLVGGIECAYLYMCIIIFLVRVRLLCKIGRYVHI
jgi:hypothetical protein